jgi:hypothetical protein
VAWRTFAGPVVGSLAAFAAFLAAYLVALHLPLVGPSPRRRAATGGATGNVALVIAAAVMGALVSLERLSTRGILAPLVTHLTWSALMVLALPH